jgi:hypothetical protein
MDMAMVTPTGAKAAVPIDFTVTNFTLVAPGATGCAVTDNCGHVHVNVDGMQCNASGSPYNNAATASPTEADLSLCSMVAGAHTIVLELRHNDHSAFNPPITATVHITATAASDAGSD